MNIIPYIFYPLLIGLLIFTIAFFKWPKYAIAALIIAKPIIDLTWDYHIFLDINFLKLYAGLFVILGAIYVIYHRPKILRHPLSIVWLLFLGLNLISIFIISDAYLLLCKISYFLRILTGFVALILFAHLFDYKKDKKFVLSIFIIAGIFPILLWLIPVLLGNPIISNDPLRRIMGPYQNFWNFNFYAIQTLIFCLAYLSFKSSSFSQLLKFIASKLRLLPPSRHCEPERSDGVAISTASQPHNHPPSKLHSIIKSPFRRFTVSSGWSRAFRLVKRLIPYLMILVSIAMVYKCYSKAGWITLVVCLFVWFLLQRKYIFASLILVITAIIVFVNPFAADFQKTFSNEINYVTHADNTGERVFRGRLSRWATGMQRFIELPVINKLFGAKKSIGDPENDYLRVLWQNGILGFLSYITLLCLTGYFLISRYAGTKEVVMFVGSLVFIVFLISGIGYYAMRYPNLQWLMWGSVGFMLSGHKPKVATEDEAYTY